MLPRLGRENWAGDTLMQQVNAGAFNVDPFQFNPAGQPAGTTASFDPYRDNTGRGGIDPFGYQDTQNRPEPVSHTTEDPYGIPGEFSFSMDEFRDDPYYQFLQEEASRGVNRSAAARGSLGSGGTLANLQDRGLMVANKYYGDEFARQGQTYDRNMKRGLGERDFDYQSQLANYDSMTNAATTRYNQLAGLAGTGQTESNLGTLGQNYANQAGNWATQGANAQAAGTIGAANAQAQGTQNAIGTGLGIWAAMSDPRLKRNIKRVGKVKEYATYLYQYLWSPQWYIGVMADEVQKIKPEAVTEVGGYLAVNYGAL